jgi:ubiquinone/menaquinone biosynthesis C-methylase UbiE
MTRSQDYVLGDSATAARRLVIQDAHFSETSEKLLDELALRPNDRVVELGCGPGSFSHRIMGRLTEGGVLVGVDCTAGLLEQARGRLAGVGSARFEPVLADIAQLGDWLDGADVVVGRAVLHHVPMAEFLVGRLRTHVRPGTRVGFIEPDFRSSQGRIAYLEATGRKELSPLAAWATSINQLYQYRGVSPAVGATLARTMETAGFSNVKSSWNECRSEGVMIENMLMFYDEVRDRLADLGILTAEQVANQQHMLRALKVENLPAAWGTFRVMGEA